MRCPSRAPSSPARSWTPSYWASPSSTTRRSWCRCYWLKGAIRHRLLMDRLLIVMTCLCGLPPHPSPRWPVLTTSSVVVGPPLALVLQSSRPSPLHQPPWTTLTSSLFDMGRLNTTSWDCSLAGKVRFLILVLSTLLLHSCYHTNFILHAICYPDAPLAAEGVNEAMDAGKLLKKHGIEFDVVYTSWLSRAIETAWLVLDELDSIWLPIIKVSVRHTAH